MAALEVTGSTLEVRLSGLERLGACKLHNPSVPLSAVRDVRATENPWRELRGLRAPGTGLPKVIMLGTTRYRGGKDFAAVYRTGPAVVVELEEAPYGRFVVSAADAVSVARELAGLVPGRTGEGTGKTIP